MNRKIFCKTCPEREVTINSGLRQSHRRLYYKTPQMPYHFCSWYGTQGILPYHILALVIAFLPRDAMHPRYRVLAMSLCLSVSVSVRLSQAGVLLKRQNVGSHKQHHTIPQGH